MTLPQVTCATPCLSVAGVLCTVKTCDKLAERITDGVAFIIQVWPSTMKKDKHRRNGKRRMIAEICA